MIRRFFSAFVRDKINGSGHSEFFVRCAELSLFFICHHIFSFLSEKDARQSHKKNLDRLNLREYVEMSAFFVFGLSFIILLVNNYST